MSIRAAVAACVALMLADLLHLEHPIYAFIGAVICIDLSPAQSRRLGLMRILGTVIGAICGAALVPVLPPSPLTIALGVLVAMLLCYVFRINEGAKLSGYICGLVLLYHGNEAWHYAYARLIETSLGVAVAVLISMVPKLLQAEPKNA